MPTEITKATLNDIGTEELAHLEIVGALVHQLTKGVSPEILKQEGLGAYYTDHGVSVYPQAAAGFPFTASVLQVKGDPITDLTEDLAAEQKARSTYEYLIDLADDPEVIDVLRFLREREVVHFQRFGEALRTVQEKLAERKFYMNNMANNKDKDCNYNNNKNKYSDCGCKPSNNNNNSDCGCNNNNCNNNPGCGCR